MSWHAIFDRFGKILFTATVGAVLLSEVIVFGSGRFYALLLSGSVGFIATTLLNFILKVLIRKDRPRGKWKPSGNILDPLAKFSRPSYHTQLAFTMTLIAVWFSIRVHWILPVILGLLTIATAYSRYALKAHDPCDIAWGGFIGMVVAVPICLYLGELNSKSAALVSLALTVILFLYIPHRDFSSKVRHI